MTISIIVPAYKEKNNIKILINKINSEIEIKNIIIVDDSPQKEIEQEINHFNNVIYIYRGEKLGRGSAILEGLKYSLDNNNDKIFIEMDADLSHDPNEIKENINLFKKKNLDLLISSRYLPESSIINWSIQRKVFSFLANRLAKFLLKVPVSDYTNGYRVYSHEAAVHIVKSCGRIGDGFIILSEILVELYFSNFKIDETHSKFVNRVRGESSVNLKEIIYSLIGLLKIYKLKKKLN